MILGTCYDIFINADIIRDAGVHEKGFMAMNPHPYMHGLQKYTPYGVCFYVF